MLYVYFAVVYKCVFLVHTWSNMFKKHYKLNYLLVFQTFWPHLTDFFSEMSWLSVITWPVVSEELYT